MRRPIENSALALTMKPGSDQELTGHIRVRHRDDVVGNDVFRLFEPPSGRHVEHLSFERNGGKNAIECRLSVGGDQDQLVADHVLVADLRVIADSQRIARIRPKVVG